jgi:hypothetical protein
MRGPGIGCGQCSRHDLSGLRPHRPVPAAAVVLGAHGPVARLWRAAVRELVVEARDLDQGMKKPPRPSKPAKHFRLEVYHHFVGDPRLEAVERKLDILLAKGDQIMSVLSDKIASVKSSLGAAVQRVQDDVAAQNAKIEELKARVAQGGATAEDLAALDELQATADALDPVKPDVLPEGVSRRRK